VEDPTTRYEPVKQEININELLIQEILLLITSVILIWNKRSETISPVVSNASEQKSKTKNQNREIQNNPNNCMYKVEKI